MTTRYAVIGQPVSHSLSPRIHRHFAQQTGISLSYDSVEVPPSAFFRFWLDSDLAGANVTAPLKQLAFRFASQNSDRAARAGAVNTLTRISRGRYAGDNTDGAGLLRDLNQNLQLRLRGVRLLVIGAGGATRGILDNLLAAAPATVTVANRTAGKALALAEDWRVEGCGLDQLPGRRFDAIIHASAAGYGEFPQLPERLLEPDGWCYDLSYGQAARPFLRWARSSGCSQAHDGLGMLVEQAAESFALWHDKRPETGPLLAQLRKDRNPS